MNKIFKHKIFNNFSLKIFSIVFAMIFWIYVMDQVNPEIQKKLEDIRVNIVNQETVQNNGYVLASDEDYFVDVVVTGRRNDVLDVEASDIYLTADLLGYREGISNVPIRKRILNPDIEIKELSSNSLKVELDKLVERTREVDIQLNGSLPSSFLYQNLVVNPNEVVVSGPENNVDRVSKLIGNFNLNGITSDMAKEIPIIPVNDEGEQVQGVDLSKNYVNLSFNVIKRITVNVEPTIVNNLNDDYKLTQLEVTPKLISIQGKSEIIDQIESIKTENIVINDDIQEINDNYNLIIPEGVALYDTDSSVTVNAVVEPIIVKEYTFILEDIAAINLNEDYDVNVLQNIDEINVRLTGVKSSLDEIKKDDLELQIDYSNFEPGTKNVPIQVNIDNNGNDIEIELSQRSLEVEIFEKE